MTKVFVIGSLNIDHSMSVDHIVQPGETLLIRDSSQLLGGKGLNQAIASARMGSETVMVGSIGKDHLGEYLTRELEQETNLSIEFLNRVNDYSTGQAFVQVEDSGENAILVYPGANQATTAESCNAAIDSIEPGDIVVFQLEIPIDTVKACLAAAKERSAFTILNAAPATTDPTVLKNVDLLIVNETEACALLQDDNPSEHYSQQIAEKFGCAVITTLGSAGANVFSADTEVNVPAIPINVVDTTGAGDAFVGGLAHSLSLGSNLIEAVRFATALSSQVCQAHGAQGYEVTSNEVKQIAHQHLDA
ncbi:MAG: ribokinase [Actinomycetaceae bacterium]|nr:ribokinase [Actinomycetaceae bacterium]